MKKVFIGVGHGGKDSGAVANGLLEKNVNLKIALACKAELEKNGVSVGISRTKDENCGLAAEIKRCNNFCPDFAVEIHNNSGGGDGAEIYHALKGGNGKELAENIMSEIVKLGQNSRGLKTKRNKLGRDYFGWIRKTKAPAALVECAFLDSNDCKIIDTAEKQNAMGIAVAKGVLKTLNIKQSATKPEAKPAVKPSQKPAEKPKTYAAKNKYPLYKVTGIWCNIRKGPGTNYKKCGRVTKGQVFTITEIKNGKGSKSGWGRLKSGAGWVSLDFFKKVN